MKHKTLNERGTHTEYGLKRNIPKFQAQYTQIPFCFFLFGQNQSSPSREWTMCYNQAQESRLINLSATEQNLSINKLPMVLEQNYKNLESFLRELHPMEKVIKIKSGRQYSQSIVRIIGENKELPD